MRCASCGFAVDDGSDTNGVCPSCGRALPARDDALGASGVAGPAMMAAEAATMPVAPVAPPAGISAPAGAQNAPGTWPAGPPGYGAPPSVPFGYAPYGQAAPPSMSPAMPLAPGQTYPSYPGYPGGYQGYPGYVPLPPRPARRDLTPWLIGGLVAVIVLVVGGMGALLLLGTASFVGQSSGSSGIVTGPAPTPVASLSPTVPAGQVMVYQDSLTSGAAGWSNDSHCSGQTDGYHIKDGYYCLAPIGSLSEFTMTATVRRLSGPLTYPVGFVFRAPTNGQYYEFAVYGDGVWAVFKRPSETGTEVKLVDFTHSDAINGGYNTSNTFSIQAQGSHFAFFANGQRLGEMTDSAFARGKIGLVSGNGIEAVFTNITVTAPN